MAGLMRQTGEESTPGPRHIQDVGEPGNTTTGAEMQRGERLHE